MLSKSVSKRLAVQKTKAIRSDKLRKSAKGEGCTFQFGGICNGDPETTVLCHLPDESHGISRKSDDAGPVAYGCSACHDFIDGRNLMSGVEDWDQLSEWYFRRAQNRTLRRMIEKGLIKIG